MPSSNLETEEEEIFDFGVRSTIKMGVLGVSRAFRRVGREHRSNEDGVVALQRSEIC